MRRKRRAGGLRAFASLVLAAVATSCTRSELTTPAVMVRDSAGVRIVESRTPAWTPKEAWRVADTPTVSIGTVEGAKEYQLSSVQGVVELSNGRIVVANAASSELRFYRPDGSFLSSSGHRGTGPGDYSTFTGLARYRGDSLLVHDFSLRRYSVLDSAGRFARLWSPDLPDGVTFSGTLGFAGVWSDGSVAVIHRPVRTGTSRPQVTRRPTRLYRYSPTGQVIAAVGDFPGAEFYEGNGPMGSIRPLPFGRNTHFAADGNHIFVGTDDRYEIRRLGEPGSIEQLIRRAVPPRPLTPGDVAAARQQLRSARRLDRVRFFRGMPDSMLSVIAATEERTFDVLPFPATYPSYASLLADREGYLWAQALDPRADSTSSAHWSLFGPDGRWLGDVVLPPRFTLFDANADHVLGVQTDDLGVQYVRTFHIEGRRHPAAR